MKRKTNEIINRTDENLLLFDENGVLYTEVPAKGKLKTFSGAQVANQKAYASRIEIKGYFVKCMENEQKVIELLKNDLKTYYALNILKHFLMPDYNILVKTVNDNNGKIKTVKYTAEDLGVALGKTRQTGSHHFKRLKELNIVQSIKVDNYGTVFAINPEYYMNGSYVPKKIYDLFDTTKRET